MRKLFLLTICAILATMAAEGRTNWRFYIGGMYAKTYDINEFDNSSDFHEYYDASDVPTEGTGSLMAGMDIQFSIKEKFFIETGINYRLKPYLQWECVKETDPNTGEVHKHWDIGDAWNYSRERNILSIPVRFGYKLKLKGKNQFEFAIGPYVGADFDACYYVGLSPMVTFKHRALSLSFHWENPLFLDTSHNLFKNQVGFTIGVNFNGRTPNWDNVLIGLEAANVALGTANQILQASGAGGGSTESYEGGSSYNNDGGGSRGNSDGNGFSLSEQQAYNSDKRTYNNYDSMLAAFFAGNRDMSASEVRHAQSEMRRLRQKWEAKGKSFPKSANETR